MNTRSLEECKKMLEKNDRDTLARRAERCQELAQIQTDGRLFSSQREWDYSGEASANYISGNYRSAIFCCACAVDQIFRYEYMKVPGSKYGDVGGGPFGKIIRKCKDRNVKSLRPFITRAELLNDMRNKVAAHPLFVDLPTETYPERKVRNELLRRDIATLLSLVGKIDPERKHKIESTPLLHEAEGKSHIFGEVITEQSEMPFGLDGFWALIERDILKFLANKAWHIKKSISEGLYEIK